MVTAYTNGQVTLRSSRRREGYHEARDMSGHQGVEPGDLVVHGLDILRGSVGVSDASGAISSVCTVCSPRITGDSRYFAYAIRAQAFTGLPRAMARGVREGGADFRRWDTLAELPMPWPPVATQTAIANYLDQETVRTDALIAAKRRMVELLEERDKSNLEQTFFPRTAGVLAEAAAPRTPAAARFHLTALRRLVSETNAGEVIDKGWWGEGDEVLYTCARHPLQSTFTPFPYWKRTRKHDLLLTRNGTPYVHVPHEGSIYSNVVQRIALRDGNSREFVALALEAAAHRMKAQGVSIDSFNYDMWKEQPVPVLPYLDQVRIATELAEQRLDTMRVASVVTNQIELLQERRRALITAAVTGQAEVLEAA